MRTIKTILLGLVGLAIILVGIANMAPVDLYLLPAGLAGDAFSVKGIPLAVVILVACFFGAVFGLVAEWFRQHKHRARASEAARAAADLEAENARLRARLTEKGEEDLPRRPAA
jgi:putative membrane protein